MTIEEERQSKIENRKQKKYFYSTKTFYYIISLLLSYIIASLLVLVVARKYIIPSFIIAFLFISSMAIVISWFVFIILYIFTHKN